MRLELRGTFTLALLVLGLSGCIPPRQIDVKVNLGAELCRQVDIPGNSVSRPDWQIPDDDNIDIAYKGKEFRKSGEHVLEGMVSAKDRWIAIFSYDGKQTYLSPEQKKQQGYGSTP